MLWHRSGPSQTYPQRAYRNPLDELVGYLDNKHGEDWAIWEFRAEGTGYPDHLVHNRIRHYPWPDHHPPPFRLVPLILASMRNWLKGGDLEHGLSGQVPAALEHKSDSKGTDAKGIDSKRVAVVHCKAGKGRSGTMSCSHLIAHEGWTAEDALQRFTERRMRPMFGAGVSIPSQLRWIKYVDRWARHGKLYRDGPVEIVQIHAWGLRDGVKVEVEGFVDEGKKIHCFHTFKKAERVIVEGDAPGGRGWGDMVWDMAGYSTSEKAPEQAELSHSTNNEVIGKASDPINEQDSSEVVPNEAESTKTGLIQDQQGQDGSAGGNGGVSRSSSKSSRKSLTKAKHSEPGGKAVIFRPSEPIQIPNSDVNISVERRNKTHKTIGLTMVSAVGHVWFNTFFEGKGPEQEGRPNDSGVFCIEWDAMDGIKGSSRKGSRALDKIAVVWRAAGGTGSGSGDGVSGSNTRAEGGSSGEAAGGLGEQINDPDESEAVPQTAAADWKGEQGGGGDGATARASSSSAFETKKLGLRPQSERSADVSRANSLRSVEREKQGSEKDKDKDGVWDTEDTASLEGVKTSGPTGEALQ